jgi:hypothetical protein
MTSKVLEIELVCIGSLRLYYVLNTHIYPQIRPHPPALARLPRTWTLYSLDQHGISLNTLYARCKPQGLTTARPRGTLMVMKDAGVFGV